MFPGDLALSAGQRNRARGPWHVHLFSALLYNLWKGIHFAFGCCYGLKSMIFHLVFNALWRLQNGMLQHFECQWYCYQMDSFPWDWRLLQVHMISLVSGMNSLRLINDKWMWQWQTSYSNTCHISATQDCRPPTLPHSPVHGEAKTSIQCTRHGKSGRNRFPPNR